MLSSLIGPFNEGERLLVVCEVEGGKPRPSVTWWRESVQLDNSYEVTAKGSTRNELEIASLQRQDLMAVFTCQATNNNISSAVSSQVTVDLNCKFCSARYNGLAIERLSWPELVIAIATSNLQLATCRLSVAVWRLVAGSRHACRRITYTFDEHFSVNVSGTAHRASHERTQCRL